jgi:hypothetical protein
MACFIVPVTEAVVTTTLQLVLSRRAHAEGQPEVPTFAEKLGWLNKMLWGGSALLAFEHIWHGEVTPWFPFLTAAADPAETQEMLHEMATNGVLMAVLVTAVWGAMLLASKLLERRSGAAPAPAK